MALEFRKRGNTLRTEAPLTYFINYTDAYFTDPSHVEMFRDSPPDIVHVGKAVPVTHCWGPIPMLGGENQRTSERRRSGRRGLHWENIRLISPGEMERKIETIKAGVKRLHDIGVKYVIPYISCEAIAGDHEKRLGFWRFYDNWEIYSKWIGARPEEDPYDWLLRDKQGNFLPGACGGFSPPYYAPLHRYRACMANPHWVDFHRRIARLIAECGYDGVFVDNTGNTGDWCKHCRAKFSRWLAENYEPGRMKEIWGSHRPEEIDLTSEDLPQRELRKFRLSIIRDYMLTVRDAGREVNPDFISYLNGSLENCIPIADGCDLYMFESFFAPAGTPVCESPDELDAVRVHVEPDAEKTKKGTFEHRNFDGSLSVELVATLEYPRVCPVAERQEFSLTVSSVGIGACDADAVEEVKLILKEVESGEEIRLDFNQSAPIGYDSDAIKGAVKPPQKIHTAWTPDRAGRYELSLEYRYTDGVQPKTTTRIKQNCPLVPDAFYSTHLGPLQYLMNTETHPLLLDTFALKPGNEAIQELELAEFAAFSRGGGLAGNGESQAKYGRFAERHHRLLNGLAPVGDAGILYAFWGPNPGKMEKALTRTIADELSQGHVLWVPLLDSRLSPEDLAGKRALYAVCPYYEMDESQMDILRKFLAAGGSIVLEHRDCRINGRPFAEALGCELRVNGAEKGEVALWNWENPPLSGRRIASDENRLKGLRFSAAIDSSDKPEFMTLHAVNFNVVYGDKAGMVFPLENTAISLSLPAGCAAQSVTLHDPDSESAPVEFRQEGDILHFTIPSIRIYKLIEIGIRQ